MLLSTASRLYNLEPDDLQTQLGLSSLAVTAVRQGACEFRPIPDFNTANGFDQLLGVDGDHFDYCEILQRMQRIFGYEAIDVRLYERVELYENDIVQDFFHRLGLAIGGMALPGRENPSLRHEAILFLLKLNRYLQGHPNAETIRTRLIAYLTLKHVGTAQSAVGLEAARFMSRFAESNEAVRSRWFPERKILFSEPPTSGYQGGVQDALSEEAAFNLFILGAMEPP